MESTEGQQPAWRDLRMSYHEGLMQPANFFEPVVEMSTQNVTMSKDADMSAVASTASLCLDPGGSAGANNSSSITCTGKLPVHISLAAPVVMSLFGVCGNILALVVLRKARVDGKKSVFYILVAALAWTDLFSQILPVPVALVSYANGLRWPGGEPVCKYHGFVMIMLGFITPLIVCLMAIERLLALHWTYFYSKHVTNMRTRLAIGACWLFSAWFATLPLLGFGRYELQYPKSWCFLKFHFDPDNLTDTWKSDAAYSYLYAIMNLTVILLTIVCNGLVVFFLLRMRWRRKLMNTPSSDSRVMTSRRQREMERQMVFLLVGMTLVFTCCWTPLMMRILISVSRMNKRHSAQDVMAVRAAAFNQILDPWVYIIIRKSAFSKLVRLIQKLCCRQQPQPKRGSHRESVHIELHGRRPSQKAASRRESCKLDERQPLPLKESSHMYSQEVKEEQTIRKEIPDPGGGAGNSVSVKSKKKPPELDLDACNIPSTINIEIHESTSIGELSKGGKGVESEGFLSLGPGPSSPLVPAFLWQLLTKTRSCTSLPNALWQDKDGGDDHVALPEQEELEIQP